MAMTNLKIYKGFDREKRSWYNFTPSLSTVKSLINSPICYAHKIEIVNAKITKIWVMNVNLGSEISYDASKAEEILTNSKTRPLS